MDIRIILYEDARAFMDAAGDMLYARETLNNLILGVSERLINNPAAYKNPFFATVSDGEGDLALAAVMTPPYNMILAGNSHFEVGVSALISYLQENQISFPGVIGPVHISDHFMKTWKRVFRESGRVQMRQRVYELRSVIMPPMPEGHFRVAFSEDSQTIADWMQAFSKEALGEEAAFDHEKAIEFIADGKVFVWEKDGEAVAMAMKIRPIAHSITINGVYTPPENRRNGYATALVAHLSQHLLDLGYSFINLYTDLDNPTSNKIYQKIGYHPVSDFRMVTYDLKRIQNRYKKV